MEKKENKWTKPLEATQSLSQFFELLLEAEGNHLNKVMPNGLDYTKLSKATVDEVLTHLEDASIDDTAYIKQLYDYYYVINSRTESTQSEFEKHKKLSENRPTIEQDCSGITMVQACLDALNGDRDYFVNFGNKVSYSLVRMAIFDARDVKSTLDTTIQETIIKADTDFENNNTMGE